MKPTVRQQEDTELNEEYQLTPHEQELKEKEDKEYLVIQQFYDSLVKINPDVHPSFDELKIWKNNFGRIYCSSILDPSQIFIWRPIFRQEWRQFVSTYGSSSDQERQEGLLKTCLLFPPVEVVLQKCPAGYLPALETKIMYQSGFVPDNQLLNSIKVIK